MTQVWVLTIHHRHGFDNYVCTTEALAWEELYDYVTAWWADEVGTGTAMPEDRDEAVTQYLEKVHEEYYDLNPAPVSGKKDAAEVGDD